MPPRMAVHRSPRIGRLVTRLPQWSSFFGPTGLDPIRDLDTLYVAGTDARRRPVVKVYDVVPIREPG